MMSLKLAFHNVRKSLRDFAIYFLTLTLGVSLFYIFNSIESQQAIMSVTSGQSAALQSLNTLMSNFSIFIAVILGFLIIYANRFLIKRRKQEFGVYLTLGMERGRISRILVLETIFIGLIALVAGSLLGILLSQVMAVLTAKLLGAGIASFQFIFSFQALKSSVIFFGLTFLLVMIFNVIMVRRQKLIDLIYAARRNEKFKAPRLMISVLIFLVAAGCLAAAYAIVIKNGLFVLPMLWAAIGLGVAGTFLFFFSLSGFFLKLIQQIKKVYLKNLNMFVLRQINSKINTAYVSISFVCLILFLSICALSSGLGLARAVTADTMRNVPYDASLAVNQEDNESHVDFLTAVKQRHVDMDSFAKSYATIRYYGGGEDHFNIKNASGEMTDAKLYYVKLSEYNRVTELQGVAPIALNRGEYAIDSGAANDEWVKIVKSQITGKTLRVGGAELHANPDQIFAHSLEVGNYLSTGLIIVVPDNLLDTAPVKRDLLHVMYKKDDERNEKLATSNLTAVGGKDSHLQTKTSVVERSSSTTTTIAYLAVYLGVIFLVASAAILAITQLSEASDNVKRYKLLHKIGTEERMINRAIFSQTLIYFCVPLALALVHSVVGIGVAASVIGLFSDFNILSSSIMTTLIILVIYGGYFLATYLSSKSMVAREYVRRDAEV
jgi:putative ABC transport system permease protein